jgi:hypothetical protein
MKVRFIGRDVLARVAHQQAAYSKLTIDFDLLELGLHIHPGILRENLQAKLDQVSNPPYEAVLLGYGLCGQATLGLKAMNTPVIVPRAHDCVTLFLGSRKRYMEQFFKEPGTYWFIQDYMERLHGISTLLGVGADANEDRERIYHDYVQKYGQDNADYLMKYLQGWQKNHRRAIFLDTCPMKKNRYRELANEKANQFHWSFEQMQVDPTLIAKFLQGEWDEDFLVLEPGETIQMADPDRIVTNMP